MAYPIGYRCRVKPPQERTAVVLDKFSADASGINRAAMKFLLYDETTKALDIVDWFDIVMLDPPPAALKGADE